MHMTQWVAMSGFRTSQMAWQRKHALPCLGQGRQAMDTADTADDERRDEVTAPVTREETDRVWRLFLQKLEAQHPEHPWLKAEPRTERSAGAEPAAFA